jgi:hypothetical protein
LAAIGQVKLVEEAGQQAIDFGHIVKITKLIYKVFETHKKQS